MKWLTRLTLAVLAPTAVAVLGAGVLLAAALQAEPAVAIQPDIQAGDVARVVQLMRLHDPRRAPPGQMRAVTVSGHDVELVLNHGARRWLGAASRVSLARGSAQLGFSVHAAKLPFAPWLGPVLRPFGRWINVQVRFVETGALPAIDAVQIGRLPIPVGLAQWAGLRALDRMGLAAELPVVAEVVKRVKFMPSELQAVYVWRGDSSERILSALVPQPELARLQVYSARMVELASRHRGWDVSLADLIGPMFTLARERSARGGDAALENRAAIVVLTLFANGHGLGEVVPGARGWPRARPLRVLLGGRDDWPRHFLVSAALAAEGTGPMSQAIGLYKEIADSRGGSGFSFNDMAANRAGTRFGELAVQDPARLQAFMGAGRPLGESDFMPHAADLPEFMAEPDFVRRFGGVGAPAYQVQMAEIERRVSALPVLR